MEAILNPHLGWLWFLLLKHCMDNGCPVWLLHTVVIALVALATAFVLVLARELWLLQQVLRRQY